MIQPSSCSSQVSFIQGPDLEVLKIGVWWSEVLTNSPPPKKNRTCWGRSVFSMWYTVVDIRKKDTTNGSFSTNHPKLDRIRQWKLIKSPSHAAPGICGPETKNWSWYTFASSRHRKPGGENELPHRGSNRQLQVAWRHNLRKYLCQLHGNLWPSWHLTQLAPVAGPVNRFT